MALQITITNAGRAEIINANNTGTGPVVITEVGFGTGQYTPLKTRTALQAQVKRVSTIAGQAVAPDTIHVVAKDEGASAYNVGEFGLFSASGTLIAVYSQPAASGWIIQKAAASTLLLATDIILESLSATSITFGDVSFINPPATATVAGVTKLVNTLISTDTTSALTAAMGKKLQDEKEPAFASGTTAQYRRGDKTWRDFATDVRTAVLTGLSTATASAVAATDSVLVAIGKLQAQVTGLATSKLNADANAVSASKLATARTLTIGNSGKSFDGQGDQTWTLSDIGAAPAAHGHAIAEVTGLRAAINAASGLGALPLDQDPNLATSQVILSNHANTPNPLFRWHITTTFWDAISSTGTRSQLAVQHSGGTQAFVRNCFQTVWSEWRRIDNSQLDAAALTTGIVPDARLAGIYSGFTHKLSGGNTLFSAPSTGSPNIHGRTVTNLAEYRSSVANQVGAIVFIAPTTAIAVMTQLEIKGLLYNQNTLHLNVQGYRNTATASWASLRKINLGSVEIRARWGVTPDGKACLILGDVDTTWSYPHISVTQALFSQSPVTDAYCTGWTVETVTDLSTYSYVTADIPSVGIDSNVASATKLATARTIGGVSFDGTANINLPGVNAAGNQSTSGNAATATKLATARTIGGVPFDGTANINLPGVNAAGNQSTSGNAATATKLATARTINGVAFDGTANITVVSGNTASLGPNGWKRDAETGLIEQWGEATVPGDSDLLITLPMTFPNAALQGLACQGGTFAITNDAGAGIHSLTQSQARLRNGWAGTTTIRWRVWGY